MMTKIFKQLARKLFLSAIGDLTGTIAIVSRVSQFARHRRKKTIQPGESLQIIGKY
jgi:hypothetical protein